MAAIRMVAETKAGQLIQNLKVDWLESTDQITVKNSKGTTILRITLSDAEAKALKEDLPGGAIYGESKYTKPDDYITASHDDRTQVTKRES